MYHKDRRFPHLSKFSSGNSNDIWINGVYLSTYGSMDLRRLRFPSCLTFVGSQSHRSIAINSRYRDRVEDKPKRTTRSISRYWCLVATFPFRIRILLCCRHFRRSRGATRDGQRAGPLVTSILKPELIQPGPMPLPGCDRGPTLLSSRYAFVIR